MRMVVMHFFWRVQHTLVPFVTSTSRAMQCVAAALWRATLPVLVQRILHKDCAASGWALGLQQIGPWTARAIALVELFRRRAVDLWRPQRPEPDFWLCTQLH